MTSPVTRPQEGNAEIPEKQNTPWRVKFTCDKKNPSYQEIRKDLLVACWGNAKMADVLYHFLNAGSWKAHHSHMDESTRIVVLQEKHSEILAKVKLKLSEPTLISFLKIFAQVGYVRKAARKGAQEISFEVVEKAFTNPPEKPVISKNLNLNLSLNSEQLNEVDTLRQEVANLREQVQDLSLTLVGFKSLYAQFEREFKFNFSSRTKELNLNESSENTQEASVDPLFFPKNLSLDIRDREEDKIAPATISGEQHICGCANATPHLRLLEEIDPLAEDMPEAQPQQKVTANQPTIAYSQDIPSTTQETLFGDDAAYRKNEDKPPSEEKKPRQPKVELTPDQLEQCRRWYTHFEKVHGEPFEGKGEIVNVRKYIKMLVFKYDETTIMRIYKHLSEKDFKWSKPSFKYKITPYVVYDNAPSVLQQLSNPEPSHQQSGKSRVSPTGHTSTEEEMQEIERRSEEQEAYLRAMAAAKRAVAN